MMNKIIITIVFLLSHISFGQNLELKIHIEKNEFLMREPITILAELINNSNKSINIPLFNDRGGGLQLKLIALSTGKLLKKNLIATNCFDKNVKTEVKPKGSVISVLPIVPTYYGNTNKGAAHSYYNYLLPGKYKISLEYSYEIENSYKKGNDLIKKYYSKTYEIQVNRPKYKKDISLLSAFDSLAAQFGVGIPRRYVTEIDIYLFLLNELLKNYSESAYRNLVYYELFSYGRLKNKSKKMMKEVYKKYFTEFPNSCMILLFLQSDDNALSALKEKTVIERLSKSGLLNLIQKRQKYIKEYDTIFNLLR